MNTLRTLLVCAGLATALTTPATPLAAAGAESRSSPILRLPDAPRPTVAPRTRPRLISPDMANGLARARPPVAAPATPDALRFDPPATVEFTEPAGENIIELPRFFVQETRLRIPPEEAVLTSRGVADIAMKRYISELDHALNHFTLPLFGTSREARATAMYREDERLGKLKEFGDLVGLLSIGHSSDTPRARREAARFSLR